VRSQTFIFCRICPLFLSQTSAHQISVPEGDDVRSSEVVVGEYVEHAPAHSLCLATVFAQMVNRDSAGTLRGHVLDHFERGVGAAVVNKGKHDTCILILLSTVLNFSASEPAHECSPRSLINMNAPHGV